CVDLAKSCGGNCEFCLRGSHPLVDHQTAVTGLNVTPKVGFRDLAERLIRLALDLNCRYGLVEIVGDANNIALPFRTMNISQQQIAESFPSLGVTMLFKVGMQVRDQFSVFF